ncbi:hypothetical protein [Helicobacter sp.]|uniref:hypothetical protein n=1 Tax=Helicobacter sp. TaxID=218 RepID=UPI0019CD6D76|nr:hypothetical protein [Helicobacter sp.]MBD5164963.1 hypothetical protein [Helicobacter sp.]
MENSNRNKINCLISQIIDSIEQNQKRDKNKTPTLSNIYDAFSTNLEKIIPNSQNSEKIRNKIIQCLTQSREQKLTLKEIVIQILKFIATLK